MARRFSRDPSDPKFLDDLNKYAAHGQVVVQALSDSLFGGFSTGYTADPAQAATVSLPAFVTPRSGLWVLLDVFVVKATTASIRQSGPYFKVEPRLRVADSSRSLGAYSQRKNRLGAGVPFLVFSRAGGIDLPLDSVVETQVSVYGLDTVSMNDMAVQYRFQNVGG